MKYREDKAGNKLSVLGLGCMRFSNDKAETERMVLAAIDSGINFFDTAYVYPGSEVALGQILAKHNRRKDIFIATKLPHGLCRAAADFDRIFENQLDRLQTDYVDYYFIHNISTFSQWENMVKIGIHQWIDTKKKAGQIGQIGFSFHGTQVDFLKLLDAYEWEFCMIQYNYYDENYQAGKKGLMAAAEKGLAVMIMEPLLGGRLATGLPKQAAKIFADADDSLTPYDWAFWWLWNQPEVTVVLSGMSSTQILESNIRSANDFQPLAADKTSIYADVVDVFKKSYKVNCTGCNYCLPCPVGINIPACLSAYNTSYAQSRFTGIVMYTVSIGALSKSSTGAHICNNCGKCEKLCPQNIPIRTALKKTSRRLAPAPLRAGMAIARLFLGGL